MALMAVVPLWSSPIDTSGHCTIAVRHARKHGYYMGGHVLGLASSSAATDDAPTPAHLFQILVDLQKTLNHGLPNIVSTIVVALPRAGADNFVQDVLSSELRSKCSAVAVKNCKPAIVLRVVEPKFERVGILSGDGVTGGTQAQSCS